MPIELQTLPTTNIGHTTATLNGEITSMGTADTLECYFVYSQSANLSSGNIVTQKQYLKNTGQFSADIKNISSESDYYYKAVATDTADNPTIFDFRKYLQHYQIPEGVSRIKITAYGAEGGDANPGGHTQYEGTPGSLISGELDVTPGEYLTIITGERGYDADAGYEYGDGGGGGSTLIYKGKFDDTVYLSYLNLLMQARGGYGAIGSSYSGYDGEYDGQPGWYDGGPGRYPGGYDDDGEIVSYYAPAIYNTTAPVIDAWTGYGKVEIIITG